MITTQSVSSTLYIPLTGNIYTSKHFQELLFDEKALELEQALPQDKLSKIHNEYYYLASASRYYNMDVEIKAFITKHQECNIINIGAGLDTAYYRIKSKTATFYEIDLPPVIAERRRLMPEQENDIYIEASFLDVDNWIKHIQDKTLPTLLIISGVFYYFKEEEVDTFFLQIKNKFNLLEAVFDCNNQIALSISNRYVRKTGNKSAPMYFYINSIDAYLKRLNLDITLVKEYMMYHYSRKILQKTCFGTKIRMIISDLCKMVKIEHIKIN
ncbi:conjugal transfer protein [candidate division KSB3 bacterium]|uniref:Conjugal transfer protein n=1 Tax=candidate division KSB3 bacterium TaxID=2044937 RepID=A0A2G6EAD5_9BACT|nr:MAG: conjugal transfer protein [candidate division KSB3 bacterium]PIE30863.1 MAG: conjugal transfer protein [candidate division KSB3 bacterium]